MHATYLNQAFVNRRETLNRLEIFCNAIGLNNFDGFAFTGLSGASMGFSLADRLDKGVVYVRKERDTTHSSRHHQGKYFESNLPEGSRPLFLDDLVCSGSTVDRVRAILKDFVFVGEVLYGGGSYAPSYRIY